MTELTGQIGLIPHPTNWVEGAIEKITRSNVHHVIIAISATECIGAEPKGAKIRPISDFPTAIWSHFDFAPGQDEAVASWAKAREGRRYNYVADGLIGVTREFGITLPSFITRWFDGDWCYECAQLADAALLQAGIQLFETGRNSGSVYPGSFEPIYRLLGWWPGQVPVELKLPVPLIEQ